MSKRYYTLAQRIEGKWFPQFGDYDRASVVAEMDDYRDHGIKRSALKIVSSLNGQRAIDDAFAVLNGSPTITVQVVRPIPGEYVTVGEVYEIARPFDMTRFASIRFWSDERQAGSFIQAHNVRRALQVGQLVQVQS